MDGEVKSLGFAALMLIRVLAVLTLSGEWSNAQFLSHDHPLGAGEIKLGMSNAQTGRIGFLGTAIKQGCLAKKIGLKKAAFCSVSFVGIELLIKYLAEDGDGVIVSQVVPSPFDQSLSLVHDYQTDMRAIGETEFGYLSLEGYLNSLIMVTALRQAGPEEALIHSLENLDIDFQSFAIHFSPDTRQGTHRVFLTKVDHGRSVPIEKLDPADFAR